MSQFQPPREPTPEDLRRAQRFLAGSSVQGAHSFVGVPRPGEAYALGTLPPLLHLRRGLVPAKGGLVLPDVGGDFRYLRAFLGLEEYVGASFRAAGERFDTETWIRMLLHQHPVEALVTSLAFLNHAMTRPALLDQVFNEFKAVLRPDVATALDAAMAKTDAGPRAFLARQPLLRAMRLALLYEGEVEQTFPLDPLYVAILLTHAVAGSLWKEKGAGPELWPGVPAEIAMEVMANYAFNQLEDRWSRLDRYRLLWDEYGSAMKPSIGLRATAEELLKEATGVDRRDLFAVAVSLVVRLMSWKAGNSLRWAPRHDLGMDPALFDACFAWMSADLAAMRTELQGANKAWDVLAFEKHPVIVWPDGSVVVLDEHFLWERVTSGLYWIVLEHEQERGELGADRWSQAYGDMWERWAEDRLRSMVPPAFGGTNFYHEEDLANAYGGRTPDLALDFGEAMALCEVQKGQISLALRRDAELPAFIKDTEQIVLNKIAQLDEAAKAVLNDPKPLLGYTPPPQYRVQPVVIAAGSYPVNPLSTEYIEIQRRERKLLDGPRMSGLAIINAGELEMLEALWARRGLSLIQVLDGWKASGGSRYSLRNHILQEYGAGIDMRPPRMEGRVQELVDDVASRLKPLSADDGGGAGTGSAA